jgi:hypothetical protein
VFASRAVLGCAPFILPACFWLLVAAMTRLPAAAALITLIDLD